MGDIKFEKNKKPSINIKSFENQNMANKKGINQKFNDDFTTPVARKSISVKNVVNQLNQKEEDVN